MKCIFFTGNSNTWGQGADGVWESFSPPPVAGEHRPVPFSYDSFVNLFRREENARTGSRCVELTASDPLQYAGSGSVTAGGDLFRLRRGSLSFSAEGSLFRFFLCRGPEYGKVQLEADGKTLAVLDGGAPRSDNPVGWYAFRLEGEGLHQLQLTNLDGGALGFHRLESYAGSRAVVNAAVGSCPSDRYRSHYWPAVWELLRPGDWVVLPFAINCWIHQLTLECFEDNLFRMANAARQKGAQPVIMTLAPVLEEQYIGSSGIPYRAYNQTARQLAERENLPLIDGEACFDRELAGLEEPERREKAYRDKWHVNSWGHRLYFSCIQASGIF